MGSLIAYFFGLYFLILLPLAGLCYVYWVQDKKIIPGLIGAGLLAFCLISFSPELLEKRTMVSQVETSQAAEKPTKAGIFLTGLKAGLFTFGGAYTAIPLIQQDAVGNGWLTNKQFLDGIALSGILPAPLIIFSAFVGYFGGGWFGAIIITISIFFPAFAFTLIGYKLLDKIIQNTSLHNFLSGVTAGVMGIIALTAIQLFRATITDLFTFILFAVSLFILFKVKHKLISVIVILGAGIISLAWLKL
jgi:chromate transporter